MSLYVTITWHSTLVTCFRSRCIQTKWRWVISEMRTNSGKDNIIIFIINIGYTYLFFNNRFVYKFMYCIVLYCIMRPYIEVPIGPLLYRHSSGVVRNPHSALAEWEIFNLRSISPQGTHLLIARRRNSITSVLVSISWMTCLSANCEPRTINLSITGERITFTM